MTLATRKPLKAISGRPRKCAVRTCRASFVPTQSFQSWCSPECGVQIARDKQQKERTALAKIERKAIREAKERIKPRGEYMKEAQAVINRYVRLRDANLGCVSCERPATWQGQWHASHYRSRGAASHLRYNEFNCHAQAKRENRYKGGNVVEYRAHLIQRIGLEAVEALEQDNRTHKWTRDELREIRDTYRKKLRELLKARRA